MLIYLLSFCLETFLFYLFFSHCYNSRLKRKNDAEFQKRIIDDLESYDKCNSYRLSALERRLDEIVSIQKENQRLKQKIKKLEKEKENGNN